MFPPFPNPSLTFGEFLALYWQTLGDNSQADFAKRIGRSTSQINKIYTGKVQISDHILEEAAKASPYSTYVYELLKFQRAAATTSLDALVTNYRKVLLEHPGLPDNVRALLSEDLTTIVNAWMGYASAKQQQYDRQWGEALTSVSVARSALERLYHRLSAYLYDTEGALKLHQNNLEGVEIAHRHALEHLKSANEPVLAATNALHRGDLEREFGDWPRARALYTQGRAFYVQQHNQAQVARCDRKLAILDLYAGDWQKAKQTLEKCVADFRSMGNDYELAKTDYMLAWAYNIGGKFVQARGAHIEGRTIAINWKNKSGKRDDFLYLLGTSHLAGDERTVGNIELAEQLFTEAEHLARALNDPRSISWNRQGRARTRFYKAREVTDSKVRASLLVLAEEDFVAALSNLQPELHRYRYAMTLVHYANFQLWKEQFDEAEANLINALRITQDLSSHYYEAMALLQLCKVYRHRREFDAIATASRQIEHLHNAYTYNQHMARLRMIEAGACLDQGLEQPASHYIALACEHILTFNPHSVDDILKEFRVLISSGSAGRTVGVAATEECRQLMKTSPQYTPGRLHYWNELIGKMDLMLNKLKKN